jgi:hypothetical protein
VGYLIGGLVQLAIGGSLTIHKALSQSPGPSLLGLFLLFLGVRTVAKYQARVRAAKKAAGQGVAGS